MRNILRCLRLLSTLPVASGAFSGSSPSRSHCYYQHRATFAWTVCKQLPRRHHLLQGTTISASPKNNDDDGSILDPTNGQNVPMSTRANGAATALQPHATDCLQDFEDDVARVLRDLRPWRSDPTVPGWMRDRRLSFTNYWDLNDWAQHTSRRRYLRYVFGMSKSRLLRRILPQLSVLALWSGTVCVLSRLRRGVFDQLEIPLAALSLVSTFIGFLQTLRSNQGLDRLRDGRLAMGDMVHLTRDTATLIETYFDQQQKPRKGAVEDDDDNRAKNTWLRLKAARLLALFGWALKQHLRETASTNDVYEALLLTHHPHDVAFLSSERKAPVAIIRLLRHIVADAFRRDALSSNEHRLIEQNLQGLDKAVATCERIRATPIPPVYGSHASRLMVFYLAFLPMALLNILSVRGTMEVTLMVGFSMLGLDEISHLFEQPFRFMPLYQLAKVSMMDVSDAFCRPTPPLATGSEEEGKDDDPTRTLHRPAYWGVNGDKLAPLPYDGRNLPLLAKS